MNGKKKYYFKVGEKIVNSDIIFLADLDSVRQPNGRLRRMVRVQCYCGNIFNCSLSSIIRGNTTSCSCKQKEVASKMKTTHGLSEHPLHLIWLNIKKRIFDKNHNSYKNYGGREIKMFPPWQVDFQFFYDYVSALPNYGLLGFTSLDRVNNNGNYEPGNLRWTTRHIQNVNTRISCRNTSGYKGVCPTKNGKWESSIGSHNRLGIFKTKEQGVIARNNYIIANNLTEYKIQEVR